jgi:hypothetical protein
VWLIVSVEGVSPTLRLVRGDAAGTPLRSSGRPRRRGRHEQPRAAFETQPRKAHHARAWAAKPTGVERFTSTRPGCRRGDSLSRSGANPNPAPHAATHSRLRTHTASARTSAAKPHLKLPRARTARRASPREMKSDTHQTQAPPSWRTTHARVLRARARLRQIHRQRQTKSSRNG